LTTSLAKLLWL